MCDRGLLDELDVVSLSRPHQLFLEELTLIIHDPEILFQVPVKQHFNGPWALEDF